MTSKAMKSAAIYARISQDRAGDQAGVDRQVADCQALAKRLGWQVTAIYRDDDASAYSGKRRPAYEQMVAAISARAHDAVLVYHSDRLHRQPRELEAFLDLCSAAGMTKLRAVQTDFDLENDDSVFTARILAAVARKESDDKSRRIRRKLEQNALEGKPNGRLGYGYTAAGKIDRTQAKVLRDMANGYEAGESVTSIAKRLNAAGVTGPAGGQWSTAGVIAQLKSARISGRREHQGEVVADATWPAIISPAQSDRIRARLTDPGRKARRAPRRRLLAHLLRCGLCGETLSSTSTKGKARYACPSSPDKPGCGRISLYAEPVEYAIAEAVLMRLDSAELEAARSGSGSVDEARQQLEDALRADERLLDDLATAYGAGDVSMKEWIMAKRPIEARIKDAKRQIAHSGGDPVLSALSAGSGFRQEFAELNLTRQAAIIAAVLDHAVIGPGQRGRGFDLARVAPVWRV